MPSTEQRPGPTTLRLLVVDDDPLVRRALRTALGAYESLEIAGEAKDGDEAVDAARDIDPDVILMDIDMPEVDGITATLRIIRDDPAASIVMLASEEDPELGVLGLRAGASGFLAKDLPTEALARAIEGVARGEAAISRELTLKLIRRLRRMPDQLVGMRPVDSPLTTREWQVLDLMMAESSTEEIATKLVLSIETVRSHIKHILGKLGAHSRAEAVDVAMRLQHAAVEEPGSATSSEVIESAYRRVFERLRERSG